MNTPITPPFHSTATCAHQPLLLFSLAFVLQSNGQRVDPAVCLCTQLLVPDPVYLMAAVSPALLCGCCAITACLLQCADKDNYACKTHVMPHAQHQHFLGAEPSSKEESELSCSHPFAMSNVHRCKAVSHTNLSSSQYCPFTAARALTVHVCMTSIPS